MNILVTGGSGFLGRHLCRALLAAGHKVTNLDLVDNPEVQTLQVDVRDQKQIRQILQKENFNTVFHLASLIQTSESIKKPQTYIDYNINGTLSVLEAMRHSQVNNFIFSSSAAIYGEPQRVPIQEDDRTLPINPYGMTKLAMEGLLSSYVDAHNFTGVALRYFNLYGPEEHHQPETHAIPRFIDQIYHGQEVTIWGDGSHQRDFVYIDDIVQAHLAALDLIQAQPEQYYYFNLSNQNPASVAEVVDLIAELMNKQAKIKHHSPRPGDPQVLVADASKARQVLSWQAEVDLRQGLEQTIDYFVDFFKK